MPMIDPYLISYVALTTVTQVFITFWLYSLHKRLDALSYVLDDIEQDIQAIVRHNNTMSESLDSLCLDGDLYLKDKDDIALIHGQDQIAFKGQIIKD